MKANLLRFSVFAGLTSSLIACGSTAEKSQTSSGTNGATTCDPKAEPIGCFPGKAEPCKNFNSGFGGDELCLTPPDPSVGYQVHVGPTDYTDPTQIAHYTIAAGDETNWAEVQVTSNDTNVFTSGYYSHMRPGSHHFILYSLPADSAVQAGPQTNGSGAESAVGAVGGEFVAGATRQVQNAAFDSGYPEDAGNARETEAHSKAAVNLHFINTTEKPLLQEIWVNFITIPESEVKHWMRAITWYGGLSMAIQPGEHTLLTSSGCNAPADPGRIMGLTGHFHANTTRETATMTLGGMTQPATMFEEYNWHEPSEWIYSRAITNSPPNPATVTSGGYNGVLSVNPGDTFGWQCDVTNQQNVVLTFSNKVYLGEMCNVFGFYSSDNRTAPPWTCAF